MPVILLQTCIIWVVCAVDGVFSLLILKIINRFASRTVELLALSFCCLHWSTEYDLAFAQLCFQFQFPDFHGWVPLSNIAVHQYCLENRIILSENQIQFTWFLFMLNFCISSKWIVIRCVVGMSESGIRKCLFSFFCWWSQGTMYCIVFIYSMNYMLWIFGSLKVRAFPWVVFPCKY